MGWRERSAPSGLDQLARRHGMTSDELLRHPELIAAYVGTAEGGSGPRAKAVAESFLDLVDVNGGGPDGIRKTLPSYDTMTMATPTRIGMPGEPNSVIRSYNPAKGQGIVDHVNGVMGGKTERLLPAGYTQNFSPSAARVQPTRGWTYAKTPDGKTIYSPSWGVGPVSRGEYKDFGGEILVPGGPDHATKVKWSGGAGVTPAEVPGQPGFAATAATAPQPKTSEGAGAFSSYSEVPDPSLSKTATDSARLSGAFSPTGAPPSLDTPPATPTPTPTPSGGGLFGPIEASTPQAKSAFGQIGDGMKGLAGAFGGQKDSEGGKAAAQALDGAFASNRSAIAEANQREQAARAEMLRLTQMRAKANGMV